VTERAPSRLGLEAGHLWAKLSGRRARAQAAAKRGFAAALARLGPGDTAIDLGANAGEFTRPMAETGARVFAFEPDPHALDRLGQVAAAYPNVTVIPAAAGTEDGQATLYRTADFDRAPDRRSKSSSIYAEKRNVDAERALTIEIRDFPAFLDRLDTEIALIKIDIEGAEVALLEALLPHPAAARIGEIYVETHERRLPHLAARTRALKARTAGCDRPRVNWDWH